MREIEIERNHEPARKMHVLWSKLAASLATLSLKPPNNNNNNKSHSFSLDDPIYLWARISPLSRVIWQIDQNTWALCFQTGKPFQTTHTFTLTDHLKVCVSLSLSLASYILLAWLFFVSPRTRSLLTEHRQCKFLLKFHWTDNHEHNSRKWFLWSFMRVIFVVVVVICDRW